MLLYIVFYHSYMQIHTSVTLPKQTCSWNISQVRSSTDYRYIIVQNAYFPGLASSMDHLYWISNGAVFNTRRKKPTKIHNSMVIFMFLTLCLNVCMSKWSEQMLLYFELFSFLPVCPLFYMYTVLPVYLLLDTFNTNAI